MIAADVRAPAVPPVVADVIARRRQLRLGLSTMDPKPVRDLLTAAAQGDQAAWNEIVERYKRLVWSVIRSFRLDDAAAADVAQTVWLRLVEYANRIRDPERLASWLATTARNESIRTLNRQRKQTPTAFEYDIADTLAPTADESLITAEERVAVARAFDQLSEDCRQLMRLLTAEPALDYETIAEIIGRPIGSIGPTRGRCVKRLRQLLEAVERKDTDGAD